MSFDAKQLKSFVIVPTLCQIGLHSDSAVNLLLGTCAQESQMGKYLKQVNGPALGIYQIEPESHEDIWDNYLRFRPELAKKILAISSHDTNNLIVNLAYSTAIARIKYLRAPAHLPDANDIEGLANYYKQYYNTPKGAATQQQFIDNYNRYVL
jgi:hypothetical protein